MFKRYVGLDYGLEICVEFGFVDTELLPHADIETPSNTIAITFFILASFVDAVSVQ